MRLSVVAPPLRMGKLSQFDGDVKKVSKLGFDAIELNVRDPRRIDRKKLTEIISVQGLEVSSILTGQVFSVDRLSLTHPDEKMRRLAIRRIEDHISLAASFSTMVLIGWVRGNWKGNEERARKSFIDAMQKCGRFAGDKGVLLGIEPINRYEIDSIQTIDEAVAVLDETGLPNIGVVADTFHMNIEEDKPIYESIRRCEDRLFHVHIADNNRKPPGAGHLPFRRFFKTLDKIGYDRFVSIEISPCLPDFGTAVEKSIRYLRKIM